MFCLKKLLSKENILVTDFRTKSLRVLTCTSSSEQLSEKDWMWIIQNDVDRFWTYQPKPNEFFLTFSPFNFWPFYATWVNLSQLRSQLAQTIRIWQTDKINSSRYFLASCLWVKVVLDDVSNNIVCKLFARPCLRPRQDSRESLCCSSASFQYTTQWRSLLKVKNC